MKQFILFLFLSIMFISAHLSNISLMPTSTECLASCMELFNQNRSSLENEVANLIAMDTNLIPSPPHNCLNSTLESPVLLIYCTIAGLIWLTAASTALFFYYKRLYKNVVNNTSKLYRDIELQEPLQHTQRQVESDNGQQTNRKNPLVKCEH